MASPGCWITASPPATTYRGELVPGAQQPLITADVWNAYRAGREASRYNPRRSADELLVAGLVWCACGGRMLAVHAGAPL